MPTLGTFRLKTIVQLLFCKCGLVAFTGKVPGLGQSGHRFALGHFSTVLTTTTAMDPRPRESGMSDQLAISR